ncbi:hypothetical protein LTR70_007515 [Exophiala xenobiotica]|nr:hypothetical protein LTR70_007515 [Exophiala xenobiotica]
MPKSLREQLVGAWDLIEYCAYMPNDESDKMYPMGPEAKGIIMYTPDGHMSAQLLTRQKTFSRYSGTEDDWAQAGKNYVAYTGQFYLDEQGDKQGPVLMHHMRTSNLPELVGDTQRRLCKIQDESDGKYLYLSLGETRKVFGEDRMIRVRWRRMPDNQATKPPAKL